MNTGKWHGVRDLFDQVCDLPQEQWRAHLAQLTDDAELTEEVCALLQAQTVGLSRVRSRLDTIISHALTPELDVGQRLGPWRLVDKLASGGMGTVFQAERADGLYQRTVAIKLLHGLSGAAESERLVAERQILAGLQLPHVARLYDGGSTPDGAPYLVMEYVQGVPLDRYCSENDVGLKQRLGMFLAICETVQAAHERLVLHCDLKPSNVLVGDDGQPVLLDFGVARMLNDSHQLQAAGFCTPRYASPELVRGDTVGVASDVYSLGVMLLELLGGGPVPRELHDACRPLVAPSDNASPTLAWRRQLRGDLDAIAAMACHPDSASRYQSVHALSSDIRRYLVHKPVGARQGGRLYALRKGVRRHWRAFSVGVVGTGLAGLFALSLMQAREQAEQEAAIARQVSDFLIGAFETADPRKRTERGELELTARQLLDNATFRVARDLEDAPVQLARMRSVLGQAYQNLGVPLQAEKLLREAADSLLDPRIGRAVDAAAVMSDLSIERTRSGDGAAGLEMANRGLALLVGRGAKFQKAQIYNAQALALTNLQQFDKAEQAFNRSIEIHSALPGQDGPARLAMVKHNLGLMYWRWGKQAAAEQQFRSVIAALPRRGTSLSHAVETRLAQILREQGRYAEALPLLQEGMQRAIALYGPQSSFVLLQHEALADLYQDWGDYRSADQQHQARLALGEVVEGLDSIGQAMALYNYGTLQEARGDLAGAERLYRQSWEIRKQKLGVDSPISMRGEVGLAQLLTSRGEFQQAWPLIEHADAGLAESLPEDAPARLEARLVRIQWHIGAGETEVAAGLLDTLTMIDMPYPQRLQRYEAEALLAEAAGDSAAALAVRQRSLRLAAATFGESNPESARQRVGVAGCLLLLGRRSEAQTELELAVPVLRAQLLPGSALLQQVDGLLAQAG
ncbi:serine/threonine protein kinase [Lysobacter ciconiae]|uniref:Serine/threonine protein kinase n=1 Tax=Novilysobacter ciconiae TaxID=2781022 RepID=A0A7S6UEF7_9GAMM|nr:serine/threonine-protein kinase [Lysobacter ciconiae]QOW18777.1 serine/threonine protein kinase [Lysobacter ciconiae]